MGSSLLYISIAYYMQTGGGGVQKACNIAYVLNGRPLRDYGFQWQIYIFLRLWVLNREHGYFMAVLSF